MIDFEDELTSPIKILFSVDIDFYSDIISNLKKECNSAHPNETPIEYIVISTGCSFEESEMFRVLVGNESVMEGTIPEDLDDFYEMLKSIINAWFPRIIEQQNITKEKLKELEYEGCNDELLFNYYYFFDNPRAFLYLKRLGKRYPKSSYGRRLRQAYLGNLDLGIRTKNAALIRKDNVRKRKHKRNAF
ncbi:MAG: hypothetical protein MJ188_10430 [Treponema sp.]|nr:hypothetical protein [Treponema sp.]